MDEQVFRADSLSGNTYEIDTEAHVQGETEGLQSVEVNEPVSILPRPSRKN